MVDSFDPIEFYKIASKIYIESETLDSCAARTCINRAYYASFLTAREKYALKDDSHRAVINHCKTKNPKIGNRLDTLFTKRKEADYDLKENITKYNSGNMLKLAENILQSLGKL